MAVNPEATLTDASTISWNSLTSPVAKVTLGANRTIGAATGAVAGTFASLLVIQDGTGSRTMAINQITVNGGSHATGLTAGNAGITLTTAANSVDLVTFLFFDAGTPLINANLDFKNS